MYVDCRFEINTETGVITVKLCHQLGRCIDYERQLNQRYTLTVTAADQQGEGNYVQVHLEKKTVFSVFFRLAKTVNCCNYSYFV